MRSECKTALLLAPVLLLMAVPLASCAKDEPVGGAPGGAAASSGPAAVSHGGPVRDHVSFVDALRARGVTVTVAGAAEQPFLRGKGTQLQLGGAGLAASVTVESYDYDQPDTATEDTGSIDPGGSPRTMKVAWVDAPHFYHAERLVVLYVGTDPATQKLLSDLLGPQFAGQ